MSFIEIRKRLINIEDIELAYIDEEQELLVLKFKNKPSIEIDYSEVKNNVNEEKEIEKDYIIIRTALLFNKYDNIENYKSMLDVVKWQLNDRNEKIESIRKIVSRGTMSTYKKIKMISILLK